MPERKTQSISGKGCTYMTVRKVTKTTLITEHPSDAEPLHTCHLTPFDHWYKIKIYDYERKRKRTKIYYYGLAGVAQWLSVDLKTRRSWFNS